MTLALYGRYVRPVPIGADDASVVPPKGKVPAHGAHSARPRHCIRALASPWRVYCVLQVPPGAKEFNVVVNVTDVVQLVLQELQYRARGWWRASDAAAAK